MPNFFVQTKNLTGIQCFVQLEALDLLFEYIQFVHKHKLGCAFLAKSYIHYWGKTIDSTGNIAIVRAGRLGLYLPPCKY